MKKILPIYLSIVSCFAFAQTPCDHGLADGYGCYGIDLMARVDVLSLGAEELSGVWINDIWGWTDAESGKEYALVGMTNGTSFVDISDPVNPVVLGVLREHNWNFREKQPYKPKAELLHDDGAKSWWRDIKTYQNYAYVVSEDPNHGVQVFNLHHLRDVANPGPTNFFEEDGHYNGVGQAHNIFINEETGYLYIVGFNQSNFPSDCNGGGLHMVDLSDPINPVFAGCYDDDGYTHDTQCVIYHGPDSEYFGEEVCFSSNENTITLTEVTDKGNPQLISRSTYSSARYVHQGWLTEDHRFFISDDEVDELTYGTNTRTYIWNVEDLDNPVLIGTYTHSTASIDHNQYIKGNRTFQSNYSSGLRILNLHGIEDGELELDLFFDTYKSNNNRNFDGAWSNYPFFDSGIVIVSDQSNGLFVLKPLALIIEQQPQDIIACEGDHVNFDMEINGDEIDYQWQYDRNDGSGFVNILDFERYHSTTKMSLHAHTVMPGQNGTKYRCMMTDQDGTVHFSDEVLLTVKDTAEAIFSFDQGLEYEVTFSMDAEHITSYMWDISGQESSDLNPVFQFPGPGTYDVSLRVEGDCNTHQLVEMIELTACDPVVADFSVEKSGLQVDFINGSMDATDYLWDFGDESSSSDADPSHTYSEHGIYSVKLISHDGCDADTVIQAVEIILLANHPELEFKLHPNPASDHLNVQFSRGMDGKIEILSLDGKLVKSQWIKNSGEINVERLSGIYLVRISSAVGQHVQKIVIK